MLNINNSKGFNLVELMITLAIVAILAAVALPQYDNFLRKGRGSVATGNLTALASKVEIYRQGVLSYAGANAANLGYGQSPRDAAVPDYILTVEANPGDADSYMLVATPNAASPEAADDGVYYFNPVGLNCHFRPPQPYNGACAGGLAWDQ